MSSNLSDLYRHAILAKLGLDKSASNAVIAEACQNNRIKMVAGKSVVGGMEGLERYENSVMSKAKARLIRDIAHDAATKLKIKGLDPKEKDIQKIVRALSAALPDPTKDGRKFKADKLIHERVCRVMAEVINKNYGTKVVDPKGDLDEVCEGISEVMHTLMSGLRAEFVGVREDMRRVLGNLETLRAYLDLVRKAMHKIAAESEDSSTAASLKKLSAFSDAVVMEVARQIKLLENMAGIADAKEKSLDELLAKEKGLKSMVKRIKSAPGTAKFGEKVALMLSGVGTVAYAAAEVDNALRRLGISHKQYKDLKDFKKLRDEVNESLLAKLDDARTDDEFRKMLAAADIILRNDYRHADIVAHLEKKHGGAKHKKSGKKLSGKKKKGGASASGASASGASASGGTSLTKRLKRREDIRKRLLKTFNQQLQDIFERILSLNKMLVSRVGTELARGEDLRRFVNAFLELNPVQDRKVYYSLSGWANDIEAKQTREKFQSQLDQVIYALDSFKEPKAVSAVSSLKKAFQDLAKLIKDMEGAFENLPVVTLRSKKGVEENSLDAVMAEGGDEHGYSGNSNIAKINYTIQKAQNDVLYFYHTSKVFESTKLASLELKTLKEEYPKVLGDALAKKLDDLAAAKKQLNDALAKSDAGIGQALDTKYTVAATGTEAGARGPAATGGNANAATLPTGKYVNAVRGVYLPVIADNNGPLTDQDPKKSKEAFSKLSDKMNDSLVGLYQAAEAVDRYMLEFTDAALRDPRSIEELKIMLDQTEIISDWFDDLAGNLLCQSFEAFPGEYVGSKANDDKVPLKKDMLKDKHYYQYVREAITFPGADAVAVAAGGARTAFNNAINNNDYDATTAPNGMGTGAQGAFTGIAGGDVSFRALNNWVRGPYGADAAAIAAKSAEQLDMELKNRVGLVVGGAGGGAFAGIAAFDSLTLGNPFLGIPACDSEKDGAASRAVEGACKAVNNLSVLKNLISAFASIGKSLGGETIYKKTNMTPHQIFMKLNEYLKYSAFALGTEQLARSTDAAPAARIHPASSAATFGVGSTAPGSVSYLKPDNDAAADLKDRKSIRKKAYLSMAPAKGAGAVISDVWKCKFTYADEVFKMIVKSMVAKVMTVVGLYNLINKPIEKQAFGKQFTDLRIALGGAETYPEVLDGAMELYLRLPLLAELYRHVFNFYDGTDPLVTMIPENMGVFGGLIDLVFTKSRYVEEGSYSNTDAAVLVAEINKIYGRFKDSKTPVSDAIHAFVGEMNTSFGVMTTEERGKYLADKYRKESYDPFSAETLANESILPGGEYEDEPSKASYSDRYRSIGALDSEYKRKHKYEITDDVGATPGAENFKKLRTRLNNEFEGIDYKSTEWDQFDKVIKARKEELSHAKDRKQRFDVAMSLINGFGSLSIESMAHSLALFHETVITGLFTLRGLYDQTRHFVQCLEDMSESIKYAEGWAPAARPLPAAGRLLCADEKDRPLNYLLRAGGATPVSAGRQHDAAASGGITNTQLGNLNPTTGSAASQKRRANARLRFAIDQGKMLKDLIEVLFAYQDLGDLTDIKIDKCNVLVDNSKIRSYVEQQLRNLKGMMDKFRGVLPRELISTFEDAKDSAGNDNSCGLYYLEQRFLNEFIAGAPVDPEGNQPELILDKSNTYLDKISKYLTTKWTAEADSTAGAVIDTGDNKLHQFDRELCEMIFWDSFSEQPWGPLTTDEFIDLADDTVGKLHTNPFDKPAESTASGNIWDKIVTAIPNPVRARIYQERAVTNHRSLVDLFNQLVGMYLSSFYDQANGKIYLPLVGEFANGTFNVQVMKDETIRDIINPTNMFGALPDLVSALRTSPGGMNDVLAAATDPYLKLFAKVEIEAALGRDNAALTTALTGTTNYLTPLDTADATAIRGRLTAGVNAAALQTWLAANLANKVPEFVTFVNDVTAASGNFANAVATFLRRVDSGILGVAGEPSSVLVSSLGLALKRLMTLQGRGGTKQYVEPDLAEIPLYMRESYKAKIPVFRKLFTLLRDKASLVRKFTEQLNVRRPTAPADAAAVPAIDGITAMSIDAPTDETSDNLKKKLLGMIDQVRNGCTSLLNSMTEVMDQIDDDPKYLETYTGSIKDYETQHGYMPIMPYSSLAYYLRCCRLNENATSGRYSSGDSLPGLPIWPMGNPNFKLQFGTRGVLSAESVDLSDFPSTKRTLQFHNETTDGRHSLSESDVSKLLMTNTAMLKYLAENQQLKRFLSRLNDSTADLGATERYPCNMYCDILDSCPENQQPCAYKNSIEKVIELVEEDDMKEGILRLANCAGDTEECRSSRKEMRARNVLDLNIVPINLTMLGREVPLINLYNYSYTFDKFVMEMFGCDDAAVTGTDTPAQALGKLLCNPYGDVTKDMLYGGTLAANVGAIFRGGMGKDLGRPRFLGDHLYNKALLGELYVRGTNTELGTDGLDSRGAEVSSALRARDNPLGTANSRYLTYPTKTDAGVVETKSVDFGAGTPSTSVAQSIGKMRFDTKLVRNIFWLTNLQRAMRLKLAQELEWYDTRIISGHALLNSDVTEVHGIAMDGNRVADSKSLRY